MNNPVAELVTILIVTLFIIIKLADRAEYMYFMSFSRQATEINTWYFWGYNEKSSLTLLVEMEIVTCFKQSSLAISVKSLLKMHFFCLINSVSENLS